MFKFKEVIHLAAKPTNHKLGKLLTEEPSPGNDERVKVGGHGFCHDITNQAIIVWTFQSILNSWIPVFTGMTENKTYRKIVTPAKAGVQCGVPK